MSLVLAKALLYGRARAARAARVRQQHEPLYIQRKFSRDEKICRVCCEIGNIPIFADFLTDSTIADSIALCSDIQVSIDDCFPKWLCKKCLKLLNNSIKFRELCHKSTQKLQKMKVEQTAENPPDTERDYDDNVYIPSNYGNDGAESWTSTAAVATCTTCDGNFIEIEAYRAHLPTCNLLNISKYQNDVIDRKDANTLAKFKKEKGKYLCEICGKALSQPQSLAVHRTIHGNVFPFKCEQCPYRGKTKDLLKTHQRTHLAVKPYMCAVCSKTFTTCSNLAKHTLQHQPVKPIKCPHCSKEIRDKNRLRRHIKDMHMVVAPVDCDICAKRFNKRKSLRVHRMKVHNLKCERTGRWPSYLLCQPQDPEIPSTSDIIQHLEPEQ